MAILIDFSQVVLSACYAFSDQLSVDSEDKDQARNLVRHVILSQLKYYNTTFKEKYGKLIVCCDGKHYWRRKLFAPYKACRKKARAESNLDWKLIFEVIDQTIQDLKENFLFPVIQINEAEGDDVIATLTKYFQENEMVEQNVLFSFPQDVLIVSSDKDLVQLHKYENVSQIAPMNKKRVKDPDPKQYLIEKVIKGDRGDGIPSVLNPEDTYINDQVKPLTMTKKRLTALLETGLDNCQDETIKKRWLMNRQLIDFDYIPKEIEQVIIEHYNQPIKGTRSKIFNYLISHKCNILVRDVSSFNN